MLKSLLSLLLGFLVTGCIFNKDPKDAYFWTKKHGSFIEKKPIWESSSIEVHAYFGIDYRNFDDSFQKFNGDPLGPIVGIWKTKVYSGEKPLFEECGEGGSIQNSNEVGTPEYEKERKEIILLYEKYLECVNYNENLKERSAKIKYYYARSSDGHRPKVPQRVEQHALYEANMSFGPLGGVPFEKLNDDHKNNKDQLENWYCYNFGEKDCFRLPGNESSIYYKVRSILKEPLGAEGLASAPWQSPEYVHDNPYDWEEIKGIEINKKQYDYLYEKYKISGNKPVIFRLDHDAPEITDFQKSYIEATKWGADTDEDAYNSLIREFHSSK